MSDLVRGTIGWFALGTATLGITEGQTLRLSIVNVGPHYCHSIVWHLAEPWGKNRSPFSREKAKTVT